MANDKREQAVDAETFNKLRSREKWSQWFANKKAYKGRFSCRYCGNRSDPERCQPFPGHTMHCGNCNEELSRRTGGGQGDPFGWVLDAPTITKATAEAQADGWVAIGDLNSLPKANGRYVTQEIGGVLRIQDYDSHRRGLWIKNVLAYQPNPIQPYQHKSEGE